jgi:hypothetical protein
VPGCLMPPSALLSCSRWAGLPVPCSGLKGFDQQEKRWIESGSMPWVSLLVILAEIVKQNGAGPIL